MSAGVRKIAVPSTAPIVMSAPSHAPRARRSDELAGEVMSEVKSERVNPASPRRKLIVSRFFHGVGSDWREAGRTVRGPLGARARRNGRGLPRSRPYVEPRGGLEARLRLGADARDRGALPARSPDRRADGPSRHR